MEEENIEQAEKQQKNIESKVILKATLLNKSDLIKVEDLNKIYQVHSDVKYLVNIEGKKDDELGDMLRKTYKSIMEGTTRAIGKSATRYPTEIKLTFNEKCQDHTQ